MKNKIAWILLSSKCTAATKMEKLAKDFEKKKHEVDFTKKEALSLMEDIEKARNIGADIVTYIDSEYPESLKSITHPPSYLYVRGDKSLLKYPLGVTVVGSRDASLYGIGVASGFAFELAVNKVAVISGGARGIDTAAINGALKVGGKVIVVIGTGIDIDYPKENAALFDKVVASGGLIVSEFPMRMGPLGRNFPVRNRIMTALGDLVIVVEAGEKSGALISATHAAEQGKTVFAVPGNIDSPTSKGTNELIRDGAMPALSGSDIVFYLMEKEADKFRAMGEFEAEKEEETEKITEKPIIEKRNEEKLSSLESAVLNAIKSGKDTYGEILDFCACEPNKLTSVLTFMEIKGIIKFAFGNRYKVND